MTPSQYSRQLGAKSLTQIALAVDIPLKTLRTWHASRPQAFMYLVKGVVSEIAVDQINEIKRLLNV